MNQNLHYLDGKWLAAEDLKISAFDLAVMRGIGVFDTMRTFSRKPFALEEHFQRLQRSAEAVGMKVPIDSKSFSEVLEQGLSNNPDGELTIRTTVTGGVNEGLLSGQPSLIVMFLPLKLPPQEHYEKGIKLATSRHFRIWPEAKSTSYLMAKLALMDIAETGAQDAIYLDREGNVLETTIANLFFVKGSEIITAPADQILSGIVRGKVIDLARKQGFRVSERLIPLTEAPQMDECFATGSLKGVMPVNQIDEIKLKAPGNITQEICALYREITQKA